MPDHHLDPPHWRRNSTPLSAIGVPAIGAPWILVVWLVAIWFVAVLGAEPAAAHTSFEESTPADGAVVDQPVGEITVTFSSSATPVGEGFVVLDPTGTVRNPTSVSSADDRTWVLTFDEPLAGGTVGVRFNVQSGDSHPVNGAFQFTVSAPAVAVGVPETTDAPTATTTIAPSTDTPSADTPSADTPSNRGDSAESGGTALDEFLDPDQRSSGGARAVAAVGRLLTLVGTAAAIGGAAFSLAVNRRVGTTESLPTSGWFVAAGAALVCGAAIEALAQMARVGGGWSAAFEGGTIADVAGSTFGAMLGLRALAGLLMVLGSTWRPGPSGIVPAVIVGASAVSLSYLFEGHQPELGPRWLHAVIHVVHAVAASVWVGGLAVLGALVISRRRNPDSSLPLPEIAARFSVLASGAIVAAGAGGVILAIMLMRSPDEFWTTTWGGILAAKTLIVVAAAAGGAYNHFVVTPRLQQEPAASARFASVVTAELLALAVVVALTAVLAGTAH